MVEGVIDDDSEDGDCDEVTHVQFDVITVHVQ